MRPERFVAKQSDAVAMGRLLLQVLAVAAVQPAGCHAPRLPHRVHAEVLALLLWLLCPPA